MVRKVDAAVLLMRLRFWACMLGLLLIFAAGGLAALHLLVWVWIGVAEAVLWLYAWDQDVLAGLAAGGGICAGPLLLARWPRGLTFFRWLAGRHG